MSRFALGLGVFAVMVVGVAPTASAQEEEVSRPYVYGIYYECDVARQGLADELIDLAFASEFDAAVDEDAISSWGWLSHHTGGTWRRLLYYSAPDMESLLAGLEGPMSAVEESHPEVARAFSEICGTHDDYIWRSVAGSRGGNVARPRGEIAMSTYYVCDPAKEERADELMEEIAGVFDARIEAGDLVSWGWMEHVVGGEYRRLETMTADNQGQLIRARMAIIEEILGEHAEAAEEFDEICRSHTDYIWNIVHETP